ncbi:MAG: helical backbone metal receptor [Candidatus Goldbacteria bacterium]|nr:helical backbone metal receptor [Candidatus Goldiibacteriota bacterium]
MRIKLLIYKIIFLYIGCIYAETIIDDVGRKIELKLPVSSIISLSPAHTEMLYYLNQEDKIKAVSLNCNYPKDVEKKEKVGTFLNPDIEKILKNKPDLVISGGGIQKKAIKNLENLNIPVIVLYPRDIEGIIENMNLLSFITGCKNCFEKIQNFKVKVKFHSKVNIKIYMEIWGEPIMSVGGTSFLNDIIKRAGAENVFENTKQEYPKISDEIVIKKNPDIIILLYKPKKNFKEKPRFKNTLAGKNDNIFILSEREQDIFFRTGPRVVEAIDIILNIIKKVTK